MMSCLGAEGVVRLRAGAGALAQQEDPSLRIRRVAFDTLRFDSPR